MTQYGIQLYSVEQAAYGDPKGIIEKIASAGYKYVETAGFYNLAANDFKAIIDGAGLKVSGSHIGFDELEKDFAGIVNYLHTIECDNYIVPWANWNEEFFLNIERFNKYQPLLKKEGIILQFHNHSDEFEAVGPNKEVPIEVILKETDIKLEIDTYWAFVGGADPVKYITDHKDRINLIHLKDGSRSGEGCPLGRGEAPVLKVRDTALALGFTMVVENECYTDKCVAEAIECIDFLNANNK
ncbi:MAG: sugar phosphate isomerase/epimerase [Clostridia bacterium]|nr:sugar phosphate isomerase/epimerase [Clostridia bacterium]